VTELRASETARRRTEEERAETFFPLQATTTAKRIQSAMPEQFLKIVSARLRAWRWS
jgi:hypothetical protein